MDLSIVIPIYNAEKYLSRCLDSMVNQLRQGVEIILVDDGSIDASPQICDGYADESPFIKVCHQANSGGGAARNKGMELAEGDWITFVDADDYVSDCFVDTILKHTSTDLDLLLFEYEEADGTKKNVQHISKEEEVTYYDANDRNEFIQANFMAKDIVDNCNFNMCSVWAKAYRRTLLEENHIQFISDVQIGEDMLFVLMVYSCFCHAKCVLINIYYYYFRNEGSITNRYKPDFENIVQTYINAITPWLAQYPQYEAYHAAYRLNDIILYVKYDFFHKDNQENRKILNQRMRKILLYGNYRDYYKTAKESKLLPSFYGIDKRIVFWLALHGYFRLLKRIAWIKYGR